MPKLSPSRSLAAVTAAVALAAGLVPAVLAGPAAAAGTAACAGGGYRVTTPTGAVLAGRGAKLAAAGLPAHSRLQVRGTYTGFDVDVSTFAVHDYTLTAASNPASMTAGRALPVFASKVPDLGTATLDAGTLEVTIDGSALRLRRAGGTVKMSIQAKDCATGGIFQMEPEAGRPVTVTHTLAPGIAYFVNPYTGKVNFGDGALLRGKDSPQVATRLSQTDTTTVWEVASGGRMGGVLGEDAVELSAGATLCVQQCQAQNRVRGSLPVTDPAFLG